MELKIVNEQIFTAFTYLIVDFNLLLNNIDQLNSTKHKCISPLPKVPN